MTGRLVHVTDHAVIRYLERVEAHDIALVRDTIALRLDRAVRAAKAAGLADTMVVVAPEAIYPIEQGSLVTVLPPDHPISRRQRRWPVDRR